MAKTTSRARQSGSCPSVPLYESPAARWRPRQRASEVCGFTFDGRTCRAKGAHYCEPRADKVVAFFSELLVHTKGPFARKAFVLEPWQEFDIIRPLFGEVVWSPEWRRYVRRYTRAIIVLARKNGKSELVAGICLYLLCGDDEEAAEVYGAAKDTKQAKKVFEPAERMRQLNPTLAKRLGLNKNEKRIFDVSTASYLEIITADALGELGHNPHGFYLDEALSQPDGSLWEAMDTAEGARTQSLFLLITTETNDPSSWGSQMIDEGERVQEDPARSPHTFAYVRVTPRTEAQLENLCTLFAGHPDLPVSIDPFDEANWRWANPALDSFLSREAMRRAALDARNDPAKENGFRQFKLNQRVSQVTRWIPMHLWDQSTNMGFVDEDDLAGRLCYAGLDLSSTTDLTAWVLLFPPQAGDDRWQLLWRFWTPEAQIPFLDEHTGGKASQWAKDGLLVATEGDWIDYEGDADGLSNGRPSVHLRIRQDAAKFRIAMIGYDEAQATATAQYMLKHRLPIQKVTQGHGLNSALKEIERLVKADQFGHGGHPVARWNADSAEIKTDTLERIALKKPDRQRAGKRVDGLAAAGNAMHVAMAASVPTVAAWYTGTDGAPSVSVFDDSSPLDL